MGSGHTLGESGGEQAHTLSIAELPTHTHVQQAVGFRRQRPPSPNGAGGNILARTVNNIYNRANSLVALNAGTVTNTGGSQAHI